MTKKQEILEPEVRWTNIQTAGMSKLASGASHIAMLGGSRSGKTFLLCFAVLARAVRTPNSRHAIFRFRFNALKASVIADTMPKVLQLCFPQLPKMNDMLNKTDFYMTLPNGAEIWFAGLDDKDRTEKILGMEFCTNYYNECSQIPWGSVKISRTRLAMKCKTIEGVDLPLRAYYDMNPPSKAHWTYKHFILEESPDDRKPLKKGSIAWHRLNPRDNQANIADEYIEQLEALPQRDRLRFLEGVFSDAVEGALWTEELLDQQRLHGEVPEMVRVVVGIDPSGCKGDEDERSDEVGVVVVGLSVEGKGYLLEDLSGKHGPKDWAKIAVSAYERYAADAIVAEANYGGAMVEEVIQSQGHDNVNVKMVRASKGKHVRAEPISNLYERMKFYHVGYFPELEEQLCAFSTGGYQGSRSPDRADALVWAGHELFQAMAKPESHVRWKPPEVKTRVRSASRMAGRF